MRYQIYDEVILKVEEKIGECDRMFREVKVMIIGGSVNTNENYAEYICYVPPYELLQNTFKINKKHMAWYGLDPKFLDDTGTFITRMTPIYRHIKAIEGSACDKCGQFVRYATRDENAAYVCRPCRENSW